MLMKYYQLLCKIPTRTSLVENVVYPDIPVKYKSPIFQRGSIEMAPENGVLYFRYKGTIDSTLIRQIVDSNTFHIVDGKAINSYYFKII